MENLLNNNREDAESPTPEELQEKADGKRDELNEPHDN